MEWTVAIGVDTHRDQHVAVALDGLGRRLGSLEIEVDERVRGDCAVCTLAGEPAFVIEGTGSYGASLTRALLSEPDCPCSNASGRGGAAGTDKNDLIDAELAAQPAADRRAPAASARRHRARAAAAACFSSGAAPSTHASRPSIS